MKDPTKALHEVLSLLQEIEADTCISDPGASSWEMACRIRAALRRYGFEPTCSRATEIAAERDEKRRTGR